MAEFCLAPLDFFHLSIKGGFRHPILTTLFRWLLPPVLESGWTRCTWRIDTTTLRCLPRSGVYSSIGLGSGFCCGRSQYSHPRPGLVPSVGRRSVHDIDGSSQASTFCGLYIAPSTRCKAFPVSNSSIGKPSRSPSVFFIFSPNPAEMIHSKKKQIPLLHPPNPGISSKKDYQKPWVPTKGPVISRFQVLGGFGAF